MIKHQKTKNNICSEGPFTFLVLVMLVWLVWYSPKELKNYIFYKMQKIQVSIIIPSSRVKSHTDIDMERNSRIELE